MTTQKRQQLRLVFKKDSWISSSVSENSPLLEVIRVLNEAPLKIALITNSKGELSGTVSDGDIRRGLLRGLTLSSNVNAVMRKNPVVASKGMSMEEIAQLMKSKKILEIPIVDENLKIFGLYVWDDLEPEREKENIMIIMAGGKGTRLLPATQDTPKPMLQVAGKPILEHIIIQAKAEGFQYFILAIHHLGNVIENYFQDGTSLGVNISYLYEESPLGTAGALSLLREFPTNAILVTNGDVLTKIRYSDILEHHIQNEADATMAVQAFEWKNPFGVVQTQGFKITGYEEKPIQHFLINAGVYVLEPKCLPILEKSRYCDMPSLFEAIRSRGMKAIAFPIHEAWIDVGRPDDLQRALIQYAEDPSSD